MKFSEQWLREWVNPDIDSAALMSQLTMAGLEVDGHESVAADFSGVVVGEVLAVEPHPDAERLSVCRVTDGESEFSIVCGAPNVKAGMKVPLARIGAELPGQSMDQPLVIRQARLRGVESHGMLCSASELGLAEQSDGLMALPPGAPTGEDFRKWLGLDDISVELDLTPNRGDCLGIAGLAREVAALNRINVREPDMAPVLAVTDARFPVRIEAPDACPRYLGRVIQGIDPQARTPLWMQERLRRSGLRSIDPVVDVTNYVLLELGQPMHAFDLAKLEGGITVRMARKGEKLTLLDGQALELDVQHLLIADDSRPLALAGIMGGEHSGVTESTRDVFLECAFFAPLAIAGKAREFGLHTDSSHRFERGVDHDLQYRAMERATELLLEISGGRPGPVTEATGNLPEPRTVELRFANIERLLGLEIPEPDVREILERLGFVLVGEKCEDGESRTLAGPTPASAPAVLEFEVPSFRFDVAIEADLIEELARVYGYDRIPGCGSSIRIPLGLAPESMKPASLVRQHLVTAGYQEVITYSFVEPGLMAGVSSTPEPVALQNPISSDMAVMRTSLWPGLLNTLKYNLNRQQERARLFEVGQVFLRHGDTLEQPPMLGGLIYGSRLPVSWHPGNDAADFYDLKGDVEALLALTGDMPRFRFESMEHQALHPGQSAAILKDESPVGQLGTLHPQLQRQLGLSMPVYLFELQLDVLLDARKPEFRPLSRYPEVTRDIAVVLDDGVPASAILENIRKNAGEYLVDLRIFDVYQGDGIEKGKKSVALGLTWRHPSRTLDDDDVNAIFDNCVKGLEDTFKAKLR